MSRKNPLSELRRARDLVAEAVESYERAAELGSRIDSIRGLSHVVAAAEQAAADAESVLASAERRRIAGIDAEDAAPGAASDVRLEGILTDAELDLVRAGDAIRAVKSVRDRLRLGLKDARDIVATAAAGAGRR